MPAAAEPVYMEMTLEDYLMQYCEEHVRGRAFLCRACLCASPARRSSAPRALTGVCAAQVAKIEQEAETNATKLR